MKNGQKVWIRAEDDECNYVSLKDVLETASDGEEVFVATVRSIGVMTRNIVEKKRPAKKIARKKK